MYEIRDYKVEFSYVRDGRRCTSDDVFRESRSDYAADKARYYYGDREG